MPSTFDQLLALLQHGASGGQTQLSQPAAPVTPPVDQAPQAPQPVQPQLPAAPQGNAMGSSSPFSQVMGAVNGGDGGDMAGGGQKKGGLFSLLVKMMGA